jgi:hypothetical protein
VHINIILPSTSVFQEISSMFCSEVYGCPATLGTVHPDHQNFT